MIIAVSMFVVLTDLITNDDGDDDNDKRQPATMYDKVLALATTDGGRVSVTSKE